MSTVTGIRKQHHRGETRAPHRTWPVRDRIALVAALAAPFLVALALVPFRTTLTHANAALVLVVAVVAVAALGSRTAGAVGALSAAAWYDFFLTPPYRSFDITASADAETAVLLLAVGTVVAQLAARARRLEVVTVTDEAHLTRVHRTAALAQSANSANTSFGGLPVLLRLLARDNYLPHVFALKADRQVHRHGVLALALVSAALLVFSGGDTNTLVPLFAIGVFVGFTIAQVGMVRHWFLERGTGQNGTGRRGKALLNGFGAVLTGVAAVVVTASKFTEGAWLIVIALPLLVAAFETVHRAYGRIGERLGLGRIPRAPHRERSLVIVPVSSLTRLTSEALTAAASLGDEVRAVTVCYPDPEDRVQLHALERAWADWDPGVEPVRLSCERRGLGRPIAAYVRDVSAAEPGTRVTVLIPETEPERLWLGVPPRERSRAWGRLLQNQWGAVVAHAVRRETNAVICRLRFRLP